MGRAALPPGEAVRAVAAAVRSEPIPRVVAMSLWRHCLEGLDDPERHLGAGVTWDLPAEDRYYRLTSAPSGASVGLGWTRRFAASGFVRWYGFALLPDVHGAGLASPSSLAMLRAVFADFPDCTTALAMIHSSNPRERWRLSLEGRGPGRYVGELLSTTPEGGSIHMIQITREAWLRYSNKGE